MTSRERVLTALRGKEPDRVPYCELSVDRALADKLMGWGTGENQAANLESNPYTIEEAKAIAAYLKMDNLSYVLRPPVYAHKVPGEHGRLFYGEGRIKDQDDLSLLKFPDPWDNSFYSDAKKFASQKGEYAACLVTRIGIFSTMLSMGMENFCVALHENRGLVEEVLDRYCDWTAAVAEHVCGLGFDVFVSTDDMAFKTSTFFSPSVFRDLVLPRYRRVREKITLPWIVHSDGNILPFVDDLLSLGISGLHPNEKGAMDIRATKQRYGKRACLLGNVDLNILGLGAPEDVDREVRELIRDIGPGGGYIVTSGNSLAGYLQPQNVRALSESVQKYGQYPLNMSLLS
jgi:uroporphyrinogen decarboxylase